MKLDIGEIKKKLEGRSVNPVDIKRFYSVAVPLIFNEKKNRWEIIYEMRSSKVSQPREISFPGGMVEAGETFSQAAVRETCEELLITEDKVEVLGEMDYLVTTGVLVIRCFLVHIKDVNLEEIKPNIDEVEKIFSVPLDFFLNTEPAMSVLTMSVDEAPHFPYDLIPNGKKYNFAKAKNVVLFYKYEDYIIWGFTAKMTNTSVNTLRELELV
ncbi:MAG: CoA pyrophosphatase [Tissierellia bacterium]|nr:CoA pyrophosphatase [Tissierellia bacterium]